MTTAWHMREPRITAWHMRGLRPWLWGHVPIGSAGSQVEELCKVIDINMKEATVQRQEAGDDAFQAKLDHDDERARRERQAMHQPRESDEDAGERSGS